VKLDAEQQHVLNAIRAGARRNHATPMEQKAAVAIGIVESGLRNLPGGDADSAGWRQERASLYRDPTNLQASVDRVFKEMRAQRGKYGNAGDLAAAVQRPAAQYRGRYAAVGDQAQKLLGAPAANGAPLSSPRPANPTTTTTGASVADQRQDVLKQYLLQRGRPGSILALATGLGDVKAPDAPAATAHSPAATPAADATAPAATGGSKLLELFWQGPGGINVKNGAKVPQGFVSGHQDHVHVAAGPKTVVQLGKLAQRMGLNVGENPHFGTVHPVHVANSYHYKGEAIDVSGPTAKMRAFAHRVAQGYGIKP
jgi:hypothetical protein